MGAQQLSQTPLKKPQKPQKPQNWSQAMSIKKTLQEIAMDKAEYVIDGKWSQVSDLVLAYNKFPLAIDKLIFIAILNLMRPWNMKHGSLCIARISDRMITKYFGGQPCRSQVRLSLDRLEEAKFIKRNVKGNQRGTIVVLKNPAFTEEVMGDGVVVRSAHKMVVPCNHPMVVSSAHKMVAGSAHKSFKSLDCRQILDKAKVNGISNEIKRRTSTANGNDLEVSEERNVTTRGRALSNPVSSVKDLKPDDEWWQTAKAKTAHILQKGTA